MVKELLERGVDIGSVDINGRTALLLGSINCLINSI
jgi:hypothetical protein